MTTTTRLGLRARDRLRVWLSQRDPIALIAAVLLPLIAAGAVARQLVIARPIVATPTRAPIVIFATRAPAPPTATPALPTPDPQIQQELAALRERVAELEALAAAAPPPQIVYQVVSQPAVEQSPAAPEESAPTPAPEYQIASERQTNIQQHYVQPVYPTLAPMEQTDVTRAWAAEQWRAEHQVGSQAP